jgi:hypothetical protein
MSAWDDRREKAIAIQWPFVWAEAMIAEYNRRMA